MIHGFLGALVSGAVTHPRNVISSLSVIAALPLPTAPSPTADKPASGRALGAVPRSQPWARRLSIPNIQLYVG